VRLFVALTPPPEVQRAVWDAFAPLRAHHLPVKWIPPDGVHLTLKFLGEVPDERQGALISALESAAAGTRPIALAVQGAGAFPDLDRPRVFWAGVLADPALELLADGVERHFASLGFAMEVRAFRPHLTVGRATRSARPRDFAGLEGLMGGLAVDSAAIVDGVDLVQSLLRPVGAVYQRIHRERLS
jgi:RNA 2',3'-cyclic 3'-phosphodiesterase